jgi:hypothetical protein
VQFANPEEYFTFRTRFAGGGGRRRTSPRAPKSRRWSRLAARAPPTARPFERIRCRLRREVRLPAARGRNTRVRRTAWGYPEDAAALGEGSDTVPTLPPESQRSNRSVQAFRVMLSTTIHPLTTVRSRDGFSGVEFFQAQPRREREARAVA